MFLNALNLKMLQGLFEGHQNDKLSLSVTINNTVINKWN